VSSIGWAHVQRIVEVLEMSVRDLIFKIVPAKIVIRELKTSTGKVLSKDSEYVLQEKKQIVTNGKRTQVEYIFELDIKEEIKKETVQLKQRNPLYLNLEAPCLFKIRSILFLVDFPITFMIRIMDLWQNMIPKQPSLSEYSKEDLSLIIATKASIKEFKHNMIDYIQHLLQYLAQMKKQRLIKLNYAEIQNSCLHKLFKKTMLQTKHTFLKPAYCEGVINDAVNRMDTDFELLVDTAHNKLQGALKLMHEMMEQYSQK
jgi:hypothetical protein